MARHPIEQDDLSYDFMEAWSAAGQHIQNQADSGLAWLRQTPEQPMAEHLSFRIGNQIFFVFIDAAEFSHNRGMKLFLMVCEEAKAIPLVIPMEKFKNKWRPCLTGWGFKHALSDEMINPLDFVSDDLIEMTDWEVHDFGIKYICSHLADSGKKVFSKQPSEKIDPSIWFEDDEGKHFVVVRTGRYTAKEIPLPENFEEIRESVSVLSSSGFFAYVIFMNSDNLIQDDSYLPLYRGHGANAKFSGLINPSENKTNQSIF